MPLDRTLAVEVFSRDNWKCRHCGWRNNLHPHHLVYKSQGGEDSLKNLVTLCASCHRGHHDGFLLIAVDDWTIGAGGKITFIRKEGWRPQ